jgi:hypothetical protein
LLAIATGILLAPSSTSNTMTRAVVLTDAIADAPMPTLTCVLQCGPRIPAVGSHTDSCHGVATRGRDVGVSVKGFRRGPAPAQNPFPAVPDASPAAVAVFLAAGIRRPARSANCVLIPDLP